jgi:hypothetical protein
MAVDVEIDVDLLRSEIKKTYACVSEEPERDFIFPTGRVWAEDLGYPPELANVPDAAVESFAGVANPWEMGRLRPGERVLDLGSGAGTDALIAAQMVGLVERAIRLPGDVAQVDEVVDLRRWMVPGDGNQLLSGPWSQPIPRQFDRCERRIHAEKLSARGEHAEAFNGVFKDQAVLFLRFVHRLNHHRVGQSGFAFRSRQ